MEPFAHSDHTPVVLERWSKLTHLRPNDRRIPKGRRREEAIVEEAEPWHEAELLWHIRRLSTVRTQYALDAAYSDAIACILQPWNRVRAKDRPKRWGKYWSRDLQRLSQRRSWLWREWKRTSDDDARSEHRRVDRSIKSQVKRAKKKDFLEFVASIGDMNASEATGELSRILRGKQRNRRAARPAVQRIEPRRFTEFVAAQHSRRAGESRLQNRAFRVDDSWKSDLEEALGRAPKRKATGRDETFAEAMQVTPTVTAEWLYRLWQCYGRHGLFPSAWRQSVLCPLLKKEPASEPGNWRAVALLSHARKIVEKVIDRRVRDRYEFHEVQCGFRGPRSVETAILRVLQAVADGCKVICVLDLRQAYASVPRGDLMDKINGLLPADLSAMIEAMLLDTHVTTVGDEEEVWRWVKRGVPEGSPLLPALFNLFIDPLAYAVTGAVEGRWRQALNLFADDIVLMAPTTDDMQTLLHICGNWAAENGLTWGISKCKALATGVPQTPLYLAGETLEYVATAEYLGVQIGAEGISDGATMERIRNAVARIRMLVAAGMSRPRLSSLRIKEVYAMLIRPMWTYSLHLTPFTPKVEKAEFELLTAATNWTSPSYSGTQN